MPNVIINGQDCAFEPGQNLLQVALDHEIEIPHYCYHPALTIPANCRICLAEVWAPNPRNDNKLEPIPKLLPTCQTAAADGQVIYTDSPKAIANQKAVMEYLLINHPVDCPVCDQAGECHLQDYSYQYGRSQARFQEQKIKQPKKDVGPHVLLYSDRCIMCTRCVRFTREVTGTSELMVEGRGAMEQIDVFPGMALDNELSGNVIDICPVGALLDKDFLFQQRVWMLKKTPSIDGITASGDNIYLEHNSGQIYRVKPRTNLDVNGYWITDEVRYGWKFVHDERRLTLPAVKGEPPFDPVEAPLAYETAYTRTNDRLANAERIMVMVSPMVSCEDAYLLAAWAGGFDGTVTFAVGPVPRSGEDKTFPGGFTVCAEKAPNARGVARVLDAFGGAPLDYGKAVKQLGKTDAVDAIVVVGGYPSDWITDELYGAVADDAGRFVVAIDVLPNRLTEHADVVLPGATWAEKAGTFENANNRLQAFDRAIEPVDYAKSEAQLALDLVAVRAGERAVAYNPALVRQRMAADHGLDVFREVSMPAETIFVEPDMQLVEL
ncbi:MAG: molybdopterin-dependent oxidoreductase [Phycisphaerales bacterium]|nr:molybdopterin-dependent oxidoreductase [Phycisphaerae bacterium]NNF44827.1 molybdopterin-dependent oxidoreductase [Phycisphaerales bacterium]NNM24808.1 molybdopterin-dependent oxidoreductase [Phycisphaerales bacterium]